MRCEQRISAWGTRRSRHFNSADARQMKCGVAAERAGVAVEAGLRLADMLR